MQIENMQLLLQNNLINHILKNLLLFNFLLFKSSFSFVYVLNVSTEKQEVIKAPSIDNYILSYLQITGTQGFSRVLVVK